MVGCHELRHPGHAAALGVGVVAALERDVDQRIGDRMHARVTDHRSPGSGSSTEFHGSKPRKASTGPPRSAIVQPFFVLLCLASECSMGVERADRAFIEQGSIVASSNHHGGKLTMTRKLPKIAITSQSVAVQPALSPGGHRNCTRPSSGRHATLIKRGVGEHYYRSERRFRHADPPSSENFPRSAHH